MPNHDLLPELRRKRVVTIDQLNSLHPLVRMLEAQLEEIDRKIAENNYYKPPPRPM